MPKTPARKTRYRGKTHQINVFFSLANQDLYNWLAEEYGTNGSAILEVLKERKQLSEEGRPRRHYIDGELCEGYFETIDLSDTLKD